MDCDPGSARRAGARVWLVLRPRDEQEVAALYRSGRTREARGRLEPWLKRAPDSAPALVWKARLALAERRMAEAAEALQRAKLRNAPRAELDVLFALARAIWGDFLETEPILRDRFNAR